MGQVKLTGLENTVVRAIGFAESMLGAEIQDHVRMESEGATDALNPLISAGVVGSISYAEQVQLAEIPVTASELKSSRKLKRALIRS